MTSYDSKPKSSIRIYTYKRELRHTYEEIDRKINDVDEHKVLLRTWKDKDTDRYSRFLFTRVDHDDSNLLWYSVNVTRQLSESESQTLHHDVCFSMKGFLIITGMTYRNTMIKYLCELLHGSQLVFGIRYLSKAEIQKLTDLLIIKNVNRVYRPRFHSFMGYRNRKFNDFMISEDRCATNDGEYPNMMKDCHYFEPIFKINEINGNEFVTDLKISRGGHIYSSRGMTFEQWVLFMREYVPWCL